MEESTQLYIQESLMECRRILAASEISVFFLKRKRWGESEVFFFLIPLPSSLLPDRNNIEAHAIKYACTAVYKNDMREPSKLAI